MAKLLLKAREIGQQVSVHLTDAKARDLYLKVCPPLESGVPAGLAAKARDIANAVVSLEHSGGGKHRPWSVDGPWVGVKVDAARDEPPPHRAFEWTLCVSSVHSRQSERCVCAVERPLHREFEWMLWT